MSLRYVQTGDSLDYTPSADTDAGSVIALGSLLGVTKVDIESGKLGAFATCGVYEGTKASGALTAGQTVYYKASDGKLYNAGGSGLIAIGTAIQAYASDATICRFLLKKEAVSVANVTGLTDSTGGTAADTIPAAASTAWTKAEIDVAIASLAKKINDILTALKNAGVMVADSE